MAIARRTQIPAIHYVAATVTFTDNGTAKTLGAIPSGAVVLRAYAVVTTAFNAGTTNTINIGTASDADGFATAIALGTVGVIGADEFATTNDAAATADTDITATVVLSGTAATTGSAHVVVEYLPKVA